jgi:bacteriochlorophyllide a dehydrogenase
MLEALAVVLEAPEQLSLRRLPLDEAHGDDVIVETSWSGISTGTERLLFTGRMPPFPGMGYPLVPGYETIGVIARGDKDGKFHEGDTVFVPGARCFGPVRGLFGGAASRLVCPASRVTHIPASLGEKGTLLALAATAVHALNNAAPEEDELIVGHGLLGRLIARIRTAQNARPVVWESNPMRREGALGYNVLNSDEDPRRDYRRIFDVSGDPNILDTLIGRLAPGGEIVLAGFYQSSLSFAFPPAFMREARIRVAAEWREPDLIMAKDMIEKGTLPLDGLITHRCNASDAASAYPMAFNESQCLKMVVDWRETQ